MGAIYNPHEIGEAIYNNCPKWSSHPHLHLSLNGGVRWGTTNDFTASLLHFFFLSVLHCHLGLDQFQACPFLGAGFPPLFQSALSSSPFDLALQDGFGQT